MSDTAAPQALDCDVLVVGGGINGAGIARDLAGRGYAVVLVERDDLAAHTSSASTKLIHGGLRYLEHREFGLVRKALAEREVLLRSAPHVIRPLRFVLPHDAAMRPAWLIRAGLFLYDHLARRDVLPASASVDLTRHAAGKALKPGVTRGFAYSDAMVDDARLVVLCAVDAHERGATILTRTCCTRAERGADGWRAVVEGAAGTRREVRARALVNAAGPWAEAFLRDHARSAEGEALATRQLRLVQGSHIVVPRWFEHDDAYIFQNADGRILFAIPYERDYTLIGTTDVERNGAPPQRAAISGDEVAYLCEQANRWFRRALTPEHVVWSYAGVRPLLDDDAGDPAAVTRDYLLETNTAAAPLLTVWGGKMTTFRKLAEEAADEIARLLGRRGAAWTRDAFLPGGDLSAWIGTPTRPDVDFERFVAALGARHPALDGALLRRLARAYGARIDRVLPDGAAHGLGRAVAPGLHEAELAYLQRHEWAIAADDVLWRRTKLGLHLDAAACANVERWLAG